MHLTLVYITLDLPYVESLKGRRKVLSSIKDRLKKENCSILDLSGEYSKEAELALAFLTHTESDIHQKIQRIENLLEKYQGELDYHISFETV